MAIDEESAEPYTQATSSNSTTSISCRRRIDNRATGWFHRAMLASPKRIDDFRYLSPSKKRNKEPVAKLASKKKLLLATTASFRQLFPIDMGCASQNGRNSYRSFLLSLLSISVFSVKAADLGTDEALDWGIPTTFFWFPSLLVWDFSLLLLLSAMSVSLWHRKVGRLLCILVVVFFYSVCAVDTACRLAHGFNVAWEDIGKLIFDWNDYKGLALTKAGQGSVMIGFVCVLQVSLTLLITVLRNPRCESVVHVRWASLRLLACSYPSRPTPALLLACYTLLVMTARPVDPFEHHSNSALFTIPRDIFSGTFRAYYESRRKGKLGFSASAQHSTYNESVSNEDALNVVLILMESVRSDMIPFNTTSQWAETFVKHDMKSCVTPFFQDLVESESTLHYPSVRTASAFSLSSMLSTYCSVHAHPYEISIPTKDIYHECIPRVLGQQGYRSKFFQSSTVEWGGLRGLLQQTGFSEILGSEDYFEIFKPDEKFIKKHKAGYMQGLGDDVLLDPMLSWTDRKGNTASPFFLSALTTVSHDPFVPPESWQVQRFSDDLDQNVNNYLNTIAYTDRWVKKLLNRMESVSNNTLFVFMGDHGGSFRDRGREFTVYRQNHEPVFQVGVTFHSRNKCIKHELKAARSHVNGNWTSIDVFPTIMALLGKCGSAKERKKTIDQSHFDGQSMLQSSGSRLRLAYNNPRDTIVLRDGDLVLQYKKPPAHPRAFDLKTDPQQLSPVSMGDCRKKPLSSMPELVRWGCQAAELIAGVQHSLVKSFDDGNRCQNCSLSDLVNLPSLLERNKDMLAVASFRGESCGVNKKLSCSECPQGRGEAYCAGDCQWCPLGARADKISYTQETLSGDLQCVDRSKTCRVILSMGQQIVSCGGHNADSCGQCGGHSDLCNGDCHWCEHGATREKQMSFLDTKESKCVKRSRNCQEQADPTSRLASRVTCGGHYATSCAECPGDKMDASYCNGECKWCSEGDATKPRSWVLVEGSALLGACLSRDSVCR